MRNIILIALIGITFTCKAQNPIISIHDKNAEITTDSYLKDINNDLDKFVGTWLYTNGTTSLTIKFEKKEQVYNDDWYEDLLVGEYKYIENGVQKVNTLIDFDNTDDLDSVYDHSLLGNYTILKKEFPGCSNCSLLEKRVRIYFEDPNPNLSYLVGTMYMGLRHISEFGVADKMQIDFAKKGSSIIPVGAPQEPNLPFGRYVLIKQ
ncbi:hypothetical protein ES677_14590 [Bizionia gelidisalsuginis]|uniref:DUF6705 domain-containing protein n=2 Tax=Bizionia TaxID=283785 RepID=A0A8H2LA95_9FLAO|nr:MULTISPECIES: DUF6705 family protein [Bizionia]TYB69080.1 hypothetical protein ES676_14305 [Bizionia saleffrena]TYC08162.1 hypothetical protein ES677_14590 [Bizionia gelidisalsuginis]